MLMYWNNHNRLDLVADGFSQDDLLDVGNKTVMRLGFRKFPTGKSLTIIGQVLSFNPHIVYIEIFSTLIGVYWS